MLGCLGCGSYIPNTVVDICVRKGFVFWIILAASDQNRQLLCITKHPGTFDRTLPRLASAPLVDLPTGSARSTALRPARRLSARTAARDIALVPAHE